MMDQNVHIRVNTSTFDSASCKKNTWFVLLHAKRIPPHVGLVIDGTYNSLTIKGHELDVTFDALLKTVTQKKIETIFVKVANHPVFSSDYQLQTFKELIKKYDKVKQFEATCLSPIKEFFQDFYALSIDENELLFSFLERLNQNTYLELAMSCNFNLNKNLLEIPFYDAKQLHEKIKSERLPFYTN
jgi:hypothetical protein